MEPRLAQLARIFSEPITDTEAARAAIESRSGDFASALFLEAAASDDVTSTASARAYLADRLAYFGDLVSPRAATTVREAFEGRLKAWE